MTARATPPRCTQAADEARPEVTEDETYTWTGQRVVNNNTCLAGGRGGRVTPGGGEARRRKAGDPAQKAHWTPQGRWGAQNSGGGGGPLTPPAQQGFVHS